MLKLYENKIQDRARPGQHLGVPSLVTALSWIIVLVVAVSCLLGAGAPGGQVAAYLAAWLLGCTLPGVMVWRALAGASSLDRELGFGSVLGIVLQLLVWAGATTLHRPGLMVLLPVTVVILFAAVPRLRRHWLPRRPRLRRTPVLWHVTMAVVIALALLRFYRTTMITRALPPQPSLVPRDSWYNSAISYQLTRTLRPEDPFVVGERLRYHWFADAHITATAQLSGTPIVNAVVTLWLVPILIVLLLAVAAAARQFMDGPRATRNGTLLSDSRRWWVGPVAAFFTMVAPSLWRFGTPSLSRVGDGFGPTSPSGILAMVLVLAITSPVLDLTRRRARSGTWVVLMLLLLVSVGTKPSILPVVAFGSLVLLVVDWLRDRRVNWPMVAVLAASAVIAAVASPILTGSTGGSHLQLFALTTVDPSYVQLLGGERVIPASGGWLVPALAERLPHAGPIILMLVLLRLLAEAPRLLALLGLASAPLRVDPGVVWASGVLGGGFAAMWVLAHPGYSQHYFWTVGLPLATVVTVTNAVKLVPASRRAPKLLVPAVVAAALGLLAVHLATADARVDVSGATWSVITGRLRPYGMVLIGLVVCLLLNLLLRRWSRSLSLPVLTAVAAFCLAACIPAPLAQMLRVQPPQIDPSPVVGVSYAYVSSEQSTAALWLRDHSAPTDVVATNIFCWPAGRDKPHCRINSMWLPGISGRQMVLGDWSYSSATMSALDGTWPSNQMLTPWPERRELSTAAVEEPTREVLGELREKYDTRWIFADDRSTDISPRLKKLATLRYSSDHIEIYQLRDSYGQGS